MPLAIVKGGDKGVRVIVDGNNEGSYTVPAGVDQEVTFTGKIEVRALGVDAGLDTFLANNNTGGADGNA